MRRRATGCNFERCAREEIRLPNPTKKQPCVGQVDAAVVNCIMLPSDIAPTALGASHNVGGKSIYTSLAERFESLSPHLKTILRGAARSFADTENPLRFTNTATGLRELLRELFAKVAPDGDIRRCSWFIPKPRFEKRSYAPTPRNIRGLLVSVGPRFLLRFRCHCGRIDGRCRR